MVGAGSNTRKHHIPKLQHIDGVEVTVVANRTRESSRRVADEFGIPRVASSWAEITRDPAIDAVVIGTWPYLHREITLEALENGKHVLCEARMAMNAEEAREMYRCSLAHPELTAQIVPSPMTLGVDATVQRLIREDYLGRVLSVEIRGNSGDFVDVSRPAHWRENREYSGNNILSLGIWYEALMRWLGPAKELTAMGQTFVPLRHNGEATDISDIPDHLDVIANLACGAQTHMQLSSVIGSGGTTEAFIFGTDGTLWFKGGQLRGSRRGDSEFSDIVIPAEEAKQWRVEEEFVNAIRGVEKIKLTDFATGLRYMEFTDAVSASLRSGHTIGLPLG